MTLLEVVLILFAVTCAAVGVQMGVLVAFGRLEPRTMQRLFAAVLLLYALLLWRRPGSLLLSNAVLPLAAGAAGRVLGRGITSVRTLTAFAIAASLADVISFTLGPTRYLLAGAERGAGSLISYLAVSIPLGSTVVPVLGVGDLLILSIFAVALANLGAHPAAQLAVPLAGLLLGLGAGIALGGVFGVPFIALSVVGYAWLARLPGQAQLQPC